MHCCLMLTDGTWGRNQWRSISFHSSFPCPSVNQVSGSRLRTERSCWHSGVWWSAHWIVYIANIWFLFLTFLFPPLYSFQTLVCLPASWMEMWRKFPSTYMICGTKCHCFIWAGLSCLLLHVSCKPQGGYFSYWALFLELYKSFSKEQRDILVWKEVNLAPVLLKDWTCFLVKNVALHI